MESINKIIKLGEHLFQLLFSLGVILFIISGILIGKNTRITSDQVFKLANILFWASIAIFFICAYMTNSVPS